MTNNYGECLMVSKYIKCHRINKYVNIDQVWRMSYLNSSKVLSERYWTETN